MKPVVKFIAVLGISFICFLNSTYSQGKQISLEDLYKRYMFMPRGVVELQSMNDGEHFTVLNSGRKIDKYKYSDGGYSETLLDLDQLDSSSVHLIENYALSPDENFVLLMTNKEEIYRHSFTANYYIFKSKDNSLRPLSREGKQQLATFSPDSRKIAFVRQNNLFYTDLKTGEEKQLTFDGEYNRIINGAPDWVYEEEFGFNKAYTWSIDGTKIAFYRFDESRVKQFNMTIYEGLYPEWYKFKYPKAGENNSIVNILVADLETGKTIEMDTGGENDQYIPRIKWTSDPELVSIVRLNRLQNHLEILHADVNTGESEIIYEEKEEKYISEVTDQTFNYLENGKEMVLMSEMQGWKSLYLYNFDSGEISAITQPGYDVNSFLGYDEKNKTVYYSSHERDPKCLDTYSIRINGKKKRLITEQEGWNETSFSKNYSYYINKWSDINTPYVTTLYNIDGEKVGDLEDNHSLKKRLREYGFARTEFFNFITSDSLKLEGYIIKPADFDPDKEYPLLMHVYGGPESQKVRDSFDPGRWPWFQYFVQQGYIVACVDNRGTDGHGEAFRKITYMELGKYETRDQIEAAQYLGKLDYIDVSRIGVFGWSYGGYMSLLCLFKGAEIFSMAVSVAPVTNWRFYDTIYTERFMRTPQENPNGYDNNSPIFFTDLMRGKLLLIHGMGDDNVHFQNSAELVKALVNSDKQFESQFYPNKNHGISGGNTSYHLYKRMTDFILENL